MNVPCRLPQAPNLDAICTLPDASTWTAPAVLIAIVSAIVAIASAISSWRSSGAAGRASDREDDRDRRVRRLVLLDLYKLLTTGQVRVARSTLMKKRDHITAHAVVTAPAAGEEGDKNTVDQLHTEYFEILWAIELVYRTLKANNIENDEAEPVLGYHLRQMQGHLDRIHDAQRALVRSGDVEKAEGAGGLDNSIAWPAYEKNAADWDKLYPGLRRDKEKPAAASDGAAPAPA